METSAASTAVATVATSASVGGGDCGRVGYREVIGRVSAAFSSRTAVVKPEVSAAARVGELE